MTSNISPEDGFARSPWSTLQIQAKAPSLVGLPTCDICGTRRLRQSEVDAHRLLAHSPLPPYDGGHALVAA
jgi:hypothetical protein